METINKKNILTPAGIELTLEAEKLNVFHPGLHVLSLGCGSGDIESYLAAKYGCKILGIDNDPDQIKLAKTKETENLKFKHISAEATGEKDAAFDLVFSSGAISYFLEKGIKETARILKPEGIAVVIEATYLENSVPETLLKEIAHRNRFNIVSFLTMEKILSQFRLAGLTGIHSKIYFEPLWWRNYSESGSREAPTGEILETYRKHLGFGLFLFQKKTHDYMI